jgi:hypothetical protein
MDRAGGVSPTCTSPLAGTWAGTREFAMSWSKPAFVEIKMDAEAKSYSAEAPSK